MFFEKEAFSFHILHVMALKQKNIHMFNRGRQFDALSFRFHANARLKTETNEYPMRDHTVSYVPAKLDYTRIAAEDDLIAVHFNTTSYSTQNIELFVSEQPELLSKLFHRILECWNKKEVGYQYRCSALLYEILAECYRQNFNARPRNFKIQRSVDYIFENYTRSDLTIGEISRQSFMSEVYFRKLFKQEYGISPQKYIINLRIQNAADLISTGYCSLGEVAYLSGYSDYKYFSVEFKKMKGVSPSEYQAQCMSF